MIDDLATRRALESSCFADAFARIANRWETGLAGRIPGRRRAQQRALEGRPTEALSLVVAT